MKGSSTRIPTADKKSMLSFTIVDFVDVSKGNSIVVPYLYHILSRFRL